VNLEDQIQLVAFRVGSQEFALEILQVERILRYERPSPLPKAPDFLEGVVTYDGVPIPVVDLRKRLQVPAPLEEQTRLMVLALEDQKVAIIVDEVREVLRIDSTTIIAPPAIVRGLAAEYIAGLSHSRVLSRKGREVQVEQQGEARFLFLSYPLDVRLAVTEQPYERVSSRAVAGSFREMRNAYVLEAREGRVVLRYTGRLVPGFYVPPVVGQR